MSDAKKAKADVELFEFPEKEETVQHYELLILVPGALAEDAAATAFAEVKQQVADFGGTVTAEEEMGRRTLAYPVAGANNGTYYVVEFDMPTHRLPELNEKLRIRKDVARFMIVKKQTVTEEDNAMVEQIRAEIMAERAKERADEAEAETKKEKGKSAKNIARNAKSAKKEETTDAPAEAKEEATAEVAEEAPVETPAETPAEETTEEAPTAVAEETTEATEEEPKKKRSTLKKVLGLGKKKEEAKENVDIDTIIDNDLDI